MSAVRSLSFTLIERNLVKEALKFHIEAASSDSRLVLRTESELEILAEDNRLFGAHRVDADDLVAQCYVGNFAKREWEIGGMFVLPSLRRNGISGALALFAIAHTIVFFRPWFDHDEIVAYVKDGNDAARLAVAALGFQYLLDEAITTVYHKYVFPREAVRGVARMFDDRFRRRHSPYQIQPEKLSQLIRTGLQAAVREVERVE
jgi:GNAT superfamily N-acetyltransferase